MISFHAYQLTEKVHVPFGNTGFAQFSVYDGIIPYFEK